MLFTSPKTVEHFFEIATERNALTPLKCGLEETVVGAIGESTERAVRKNGGTVEIIVDSVDFRQLAEATVNHIREIQ